MRIGLTGGIASGKSSVARCFEELGAAVIDTDLIAREAVEPGEPALEAIVSRFGEAVLDTSGRLDRRRMRDAVFADPELRRELEAILHPDIGRRMLARADAAAGPYQVLVIPLLLETGQQDLVDRTLVVDCPPAVQLGRLVARDGESEQSAQRMLDAQSSRRKRLAAADDIIVNDGTLDDLREAVRQLDAAYRRLAGQAAIDKQ